MLPELVGMRRDYVTIAPRLGLDAFGEPYFGEARRFRCRISGQKRVLVNMQGDQVLSAQRVHLVAAPAVSEHDLMTLSTQDAGSTETSAIHPRIAAVTRVKDDLGRPHVVLDLNPWSRSG